LVAPRQLPIAIPAGSRARQKPLNYRTQSLQGARLLRRATNRLGGCNNVDPANVVEDIETGTLTLSKL
jgi:hypothetical protein